MTDRRTCLADLMDKALLQQMIDEGYIRRRSHPTLPLFILNYSEKAMYDKVWNQATITCRGLIVDDNNGVIIARSWPKFFNLGQVEADVVGMEDTVEITDKADGSLGIAYTTPDGVAIATRGSFTSDQAVWATNWVRGNTLAFWPMQGLTPLFEIVYPRNRIVLDYGKWEGLILLGAVDTERGNTYGPYEAAGMLQWSGQTTEVFPEHTMAEFMAGPNANRSNSEGVVVRSGHKMVKIKQADYLALHKLVTGLSTTSVWESLMDGYTVAEICAPLPDEFHDWVRTVAHELFEKLERIEDQIDAEFNQHDCLTRKMFAESVRESPLRPWLFLRYDGRDTKEAVWRTLKPAHASRWG